ncbi:MAG: hypothetical protein AAF223_23565 [Bacteroidota bacterium]
MHLFGQAGYRLQKPEGGFFLRATYTPWMLLYSNAPFFSKSDHWISYWVGIGLGHTFK